MTLVGVEFATPARAEAVPQDWDDRRLRGAPARASRDDVSEPGTPPAGRAESRRPQPRPAWAIRDLRGVRVVVVDDDENSADYFTMALMTAGATVTTCANATDAARTIPEQRPHVVLSDIAMPDHDGYWLVEQIRGHEDPTICATPIVATTAHGYEHSRERTLAAGFVDHLAKPVDPDVLCRAIARAAGR